MSRDLSHTIESVFLGDAYEYSRSAYRGENAVPNSTVRYMEIPVDQEVFEIPVFAFSSFINVAKKDANLSVIAVMLNTWNKVPRYKSLDRYMRDILTEDYKKSRLVKLEVKAGNDTVLFYGTHGAIFDKNFIPLAVCSYQIQREGEEVVINSGEEDKAIARYRFLRHILRVNPDAYLSKTTSMERFIVNRIISTCLEYEMPFPCEYQLYGCFSLPEGHDHMKYPVKVEIDDCPFRIRQTEPPSISTSNQGLLQLVIDHIEELIQ